MVVKSCVLFCAAGIFLTLKMCGVLPSRRYGFHCDAEHLRHVIDDDPNTISDAMLLVVSICSSLFLVRNFVYLY
jgi:hypothetical protein